MATTKQCSNFFIKTLETKGGTAAIPFLQRAVELDPKFAMAYARLGAVYGVTGAPILSAENVHKAYELREKVTERERLYIEAHYYRDVTGEQDKAASVWEVMQQTYPRAVEPYSNLAGFYGRLGNCEKALEEAHEALRLDSDDQDSYATVGYLFMCLNRLDEAQAAFKQAEERHLESEGLLTGRYSLAFLKGDAEGMKRVAASAAAGKPLLLVLQGFTEAYYGRLRKARELLRRAVESAKQNGAVDTVASFQALAWRGLTRSKVTPRKAAPRTRISSRSGKTPIPTLLSCGKPRRSTRSCNKLRAVARILSCVRKLFPNIPRTKNPATRAALSSEFHSTRSQRFPVSTNTSFATG